MTSVWPGPRLVKEVRALWWPWAIAAVASLAALHTSGEFAETVRTVTVCGAVACFAALSFGSEFQQRTLPLLLSQPFERRRLWREKLVVPAVGGAVILLLNAELWCWAKDIGFWDLLVVWVLILAIVTSSGFWIAATGSVAAGIVCGVVTQVLVFGGFSHALWQLHAAYPILFASIFAGFGKGRVMACLIVYAGSFVWFGRRFWKGRRLMLAVISAGLALGLLLEHALGQLASDTFSMTSNAPMEALFVAVTICSAAFWTLTARSTIGGLVFCVASQVLAAMLLVLVVGKVFGGGDDHNGVLVAGAVGVGGLVYAGVFLWLGWRKFERMQLREELWGEGPAINPAQARRHWWTSWLVCRASGSTANLVRKELRLQKPVLLAAGVFTVCWLAGLGLQVLWPERGYDRLLELLLLFYVPFALILAGGISLGEEKGLGLADWHLTLPLPGRRMWLVKLGVANVTGLLAGCVLPGLLLVLGLAVNSGGKFSEPALRDIRSILLGCWLTILLSFWVGGHVSNAVRGFLATLVALAVGAGCVELGISGAEGVQFAGGLQTGLLTWVLTHGHLSRPGLMDVMALATCVAFLTWVLVLLRQSLVQFRQPAAGAGTLVKESVVLGVLLMVFAWWGRDLETSAQGAWERPRAEVQQAVRTALSASRSWDRPRTFVLADLKSTDELSNNTQAWLRDATVQYSPPPPAKPSTAPAGPKLAAEEAYRRRYGLFSGTVTVYFSGRAVECIPIQVPTLTER